MTAPHRGDDAPLNGHSVAAEAKPEDLLAPASEKPEAGEENPPVEPAMVDRSMQAQLGQQLRALFDHVASEPLPDRLVNLLRDLESKEKKG